MEISKLSNENNMVRQHDLPTRCSVVQLLAECNALPLCVRGGNVDYAAVVAKISLRRERAAAAASNRDREKYYDISVCYGGGYIGSVFSLFGH
jgi:hypothetical protein